jgi:hypothetical protein
MLLRRRCQRRLSHSRHTRRVLIEAMEERVLFSTPTLWTVQGPGGGGSLFSASIHGNELWVSSDMSGIYHSSNFGANWNQLNFHNSGIGGMNGGTTSQVQFTSDPKILYAPGANLGVAKSIDGGATWNKLTGWTNGASYWAATDETTTSKILVANASSLYISTNGGTSFSTAYASSGLFVAGAFFDGSTVYVGTNKGLLVSTNGGLSFALDSQQIPVSPINEYMISFTGAKQGGITRLIARTSGTNPNPTNSQSARSYGYTGLYRLDVGETWTSIKAGIH